MFYPTIVVGSDKFGKHTLVSDISGVPMEDARDEVQRWNMEAIETECLKAIGKGIRSPVVIVLDLRNPVALKAATDLAGADAVAKQLNTALANGLDPILHYTCDSHEALALFGTVSRNSSAFLSMDVPDGHYRYMIITASGVRLRVELIPN